MKEGDYITIQGWMLELGLKGNELLAYALIYSFSRDGVSVFRGSAQYIADWCGLRRRATMDILAKLQERGLIEKIDRFDNGVKYCDYRVQKLHTLCRNCTPPYAETAYPPMQKLHTIDIEDNELLINNNSYRNIECEKRAHTPAQGNAFDFYGALVGIGVQQQTADDWRSIRTKAGASDTATAFRMIEQQIAASGKPADYCIGVAVLQNWRGFNAAWLANYESSRQKNAATAPEVHYDVAAIARSIINEQ